MGDFIKSVESMKTDCNNWNRNDMFIGKTYGPLPWGFIFQRQNWEKVLLNRENKSLNLELEQTLETLIKDLKCFQIWIQHNGEAVITNPNSEVNAANMCDRPKEHTEESETERGKARSKRELTEDSQEAAAGEGRDANENTLPDLEATPETVGESITEQSIQHNDGAEEVNVRSKREAPRPPDSDLLNSADTRENGIKMITIEGPSGTNVWPYAPYYQAHTSGSGTPSSSATSALISSVVGTACIVGSAGYFIYSNSFGIRDKLSGIFK